MKEYELKVRVKISDKGNIDTIIQFLKSIEIEVLEVKEITKE